MVFRKFLKFVKSEMYDYINKFHKKNYIYN